MKENFSSLKRFPDSDYLLAESSKSKQQYVPDELYAEVEMQKESDKKVVVEKTGKQLKKLQNTIMVEYNGEELSLDEFNLKYPNFFGGKKTRRSARSEQKSTNFPESSEQESKTPSRKKKGNPEKMSSSLQFENWKQNYTFTGLSDKEIKELFAMSKKYNGNLGRVKERLFGDVLYRKMTLSKPHEQVMKEIDAEVLRIEAMLELVMGWEPEYQHILDTDPAYDIRRRNEK